MELKRQQIGNIFCLAGVRQENAEKALEKLWESLYFFSLS